MITKHIHLTDDNAEDTLKDCLIFIKAKERKESRKQAFEDCTNYWKEEVNKILNNETLDNDDRIKLISKLF